MLQATIQSSHPKNGNTPSHLIRVAAVEEGDSEEGFVDMPDDLRITVDELKKRMEAGEDFVVIDTRKPQEWAGSDVMLPEAIRIPLDNFEEHLQRIPKNKPIVTYCT